MINEKKSDFLSNKDQSQENVVDYDKKELLFPEKIEEIKRGEDQLLSELPKGIVSKLLKNNLSRAIFLAGTLLANGCATMAAEKVIKDESLIITEVAKESQDNFNPKFKGDTLLKQVTEMDLAEKLLAMKEQLAFYKTLGYEIVLDKRIVLSNLSYDGFHHDFINIFQKNLEMSGKDSSVPVGADPLTVCRRKNLGASDIPAEISKEKTIDIVPLLFNVEAVGKNKYRAILYNYLDEKKPVLFEKEFESGATDSESYSITESLVVDILAVSDIFYEQNREFDDSLLFGEFDQKVIEKNRPMYRLGRELSSSEQNLIALLFGKYKKIVIDGVKIGGEVDRDDIKPTLELTSKNMPGALVEATGKINEIRLYSRSFLIKEKDKTAQTINGQPMVSSIIDKFGNLIVRSIEDDDVGETTSSLVFIQPRTSFQGKDDLGNKNNNSDLLIDWNLVDDFGVAVGDETFLRQLSFSPQFETGTKGQYDGYSFFEKPEDINDESRKKISVFANGVENLEVKMGYKPGTVIKIFLFNSVDPNAAFSKADNDTIYIWDELLKENGRKFTETDFSLQAVGEHEAMHLFAEYFKVLEKSDFDRVFLEIKGNYPEFFGLINESNFLNTDGGHSKDNSSELLASFIAGFNHPDWLNAVVSNGPKFVNAYKELLISAKKSFLESPVVVQDPIIHGKLSNSLFIKELEDKYNQLDNL